MLQMCEHKIQSSTGLTLELEQVPKMLGTLTQEWAPRSFVVSFKLETDEAIVLDKARAAIEKYQVHLVVANLLQTRRDLCYLVEPSAEQNSQQDIAVSNVNRPANEASIEPQLISEVVVRHAAFFHKAIAAPALTSGSPSVLTDAYCSWAEEEASQSPLSPHGAFNCIFAAAAADPTTIAIRTLYFSTAVNGEHAADSSSNSNNNINSLAKGSGVIASPGEYEVVDDDTTISPPEVVSSNRDTEQSLVKQRSILRRTCKWLAVLGLVSAFSFYCGRKWR